MEIKNSLIMFSVFLTVFTSACIYSPGYYEVREELESLTTYILEIVDSYCENGEVTILLRNAGTGDITDTDLIEVSRTGGESEFSPQFSPQSINSSGTTTFTDSGCVSGICEYTFYLKERGMKATIYCPV
ncbi:MAG: hypothetical protein GTN39_00675 [Candidatus Aenigmarchaeota archaeon]|nr:hypothetical protein [Candidatus Aenigmarchaeota archaeon]